MVVEVNVQALGDLVRWRRELLGMTQSDLARRAGIHPVSLGKLERGDTRHPQRGTIASLAQVLELTDLEVATAMDRHHHDRTPPPRPEHRGIPDRLPLPDLAPEPPQGPPGLPEVPSLQDWRDAGAERLLMALGGRILRGESGLPSQAWTQLLGERLAAFHEHVSAVEELAALPEAV